MTPTIASRSLLLPSRIAAVAMAMVLLPTTADAAPRTVRLHVQAPINLDNPAATRLESVEQYGNPAVFTKSFEIPYDTLETEIRKNMKNVLPNKVSGTAVCTDPCPDVDWSIKLAPKFKFTKKNQPTLKSIGTSGDSRVEIKLVSQARIDVHADVHVETWAESADFPIDAFALIGVEATAKVQLWPTVKLEKLDFEMTLDDTDLDFELNGKLVALGAKWGSLLGTTPLGIMGGGPLALGSLLAVLGNEGAELAEKKLKELYQKEAGEMFAEATKGLEKMVKDHIDPEIDKINNVKAKAMDAKLPGVNKSLNQLTAASGASLVLHTVTPSNNLYASAVVRFSGAAGSSKVKGKLRVPATQCVYASIMGAKMPVGFKAANTALEGKVGQSCSAALPANAVSSNAYLGGDPKKVLGSTAQSLPNWKSSGQLSFSGKLVRVGPESSAGPTLGGGTQPHYECAFEVGKLPTAGIVKFEEGAGLSQYSGVDFHERVMTSTVGSSTLVLDNELKPLVGAVELGGPATCSTGGGPVLTPSKAKELMDMLDPENCPQCGPRLVQSKGDIYEFANEAAFAKTKLGKELVPQIEAFNKSKAKAKSKGAVGNRAAGRAMPSVRTKATALPATKTTSPATTTNKATAPAAKAAPKTRAVGQ